MDKIIIGIKEERTMLMNRLRKKKLKLKELDSNNTHAIVVGNPNTDLKKLDLALHISQIVQKNITEMALKKCGVSPKCIALIMNNENNWWMSEQMTIKIYSVVYLFVNALDVIDVDTISKNFFEDNYKDIMKEIKKRDLTNINILGIDQGVANIGYSVINVANDEPKILTHGVIKTSPDAVFGRRLMKIEGLLSKVISRYNPILICTESLYCNPVQRSGRNKSAAIVQTNMATGIIFLISAEKDIPLKQIVPISVKKIITGSGKATKDKVADSVRDILGLDIEFQADHDADATAIALAGYLSI